MREASRPYLNHSLGGGMRMVRPLFLPPSGAVSLASDSRMAPGNMFSSTTSATISRVRQPLWSHAPPPSAVHAKAAW